MSFSKLGLTSLSNIKKICKDLALSICRQISTGKEGAALENLITVTQIFKSVIFFKVLFSSLIYLNCSLCSLANNPNTTTDFSVLKTFHTSWRLLVFSLTIFYWIYRSFLCTLNSWGRARKLPKDKIWTTVAEDLKFYKKFALSKKVFFSKKVPKSVNIIFKTLLQA